MWTVGLALSGSPAGLTLAEFEAASNTQLNELRSRVTSAFQTVGAHYVIDTITDFLPVVDEINRRLVLGERP